MKKLEARCPTFERAKDIATVALLRWQAREENRWGLLISIWVGVVIRDEQEKSTSRGLHSRTTGGEDCGHVHSGK